MHSGVYLDPTICALIIITLIRKLSYAVAKLGHTRRGGRTQYV